LHGWRTFATDVASRVNLTEESRASVTAEPSPPKTSASLAAPEPAAPPSRTVRERTTALVSSAVAAVLGLAPHVLHHAGPFAGAALLAGTGGALVFGVIGLVAAVPFLLRAHRRCGNWRVPGALLVLFAAMFSISTFVIGPAITGNNGGGGKSGGDQVAPGTPAKGGHDAHH
jgi:hypothetical protein